MFDWILAYLFVSQLFFNRQIDSSYAKHFSVQVSENIGLTIPGNCWSFEIRRISHEIRRISWNPVDFVKSWNIAFPLHCIKLKSFSWIIWFLRFASGFHMKSAGFHEIHPKPYKSKCFNQNYSVWWMQERGYDPGFHEIHWISGEICRISKYELLRDDQV